MPELPEVETVCRQLSKVWLGRTIVDVEASRPNYFFVTSPRVLKKRLMGQKTTNLKRHGKYIIAELGDESRLLLHLGMTGQFVARALPQDGHVHLVLHLSGKKRVTFRDVRKFGKVEWIAPGKSSKRLDKLGPDALIAEPESIYQAFKKRKVAIKTALLDQSIWAGVGNIYADEALYAAKIKPTRGAHRVKKKEALLLVDEVQQVLRRAIEAGGSTINDYLQADGELGGFQDWHKMYGKTGEPCPACGEPISRKVIGGRSSHFCARCQL